MIYLFAISRANPGHEADLRDSLVSLIAPTRQEKGCVLYDLHESDETPGEFIFYEIWETQADLDAHAASDHLAAHARRSAGWVASRRLIHTHKVG